MRNYYNPEKLDKWLAYNHPALIRPGGPVRLANDADGRGAYVVAWPNGTHLPSPSEIDEWVVVPRVSDIAAALVGRERTAREALADCKAKAFVALKAAGMSTEEANAAGTALVVQHYGLMGAYELAGGNPAAKAALMAAITADPPAWWSPAIAAIFDEAL